MKRVGWLGLLMLTACVESIDFEKRGPSDAGDLPDAGCSESHPCAAPLQCEPTLQTCVECVNDTHCAAPLPACNTVTHRCEPCGANLGCSSAQTCNLTVQACAKSCSEDSQCPLSKGCVRRVCTECEDDGDCAGNHCNRSLGRCVLCAADAHCGGSQPHCRLNTGTCVRCLTSADCEGAQVCAADQCREPYAR